MHATIGIAPAKSKTMGVNENLVQYLQGSPGHVHHTAGLLRTCPTGRNSQDY